MRRIATHPAETTLQTTEMMVGTVHASQRLRPSPTLLRQNDQLRSVRQTKTILKQQLLMKTTLRLRFVWFALLLSATLFTACKKENVDPVAPADLADRVAGTYKFAELSANGQTLPADETNLKGTITVSRQTATTVRMVFAISLKNGNPFLDDTFDDVEVSESGSEILYEVDGQTFARGKGNSISINGRDSANKAFTLTAKK